MPSVIGLPRAKGIEFKQERVSDFGLRTFENGVETGNAEVRRNKRTEFKFRLPIVNKAGFKLVGGMRYYQENFSFENLTSADHVLDRTLDERQLRSMGMTLYAVKPFKGNTFLLVRFNAALNGDWSKSINPTTDYLKFTVTPLYGFKLSERKSLAFGVSFGYNFGRRSILPIFSYNHTFNRHWGIESILPSHVRARYSTANQKTVVYAGVEGKGANYNVTLPEIQPNPLFLNHTEVRAMLSIEREIHDWLWVGAEVGYRKNLDFSLNVAPDRGSVRVFNNTLNDAMVFNFSVFVVPPRKMVH